MNARKTPRRRIALAVLTATALLATGCSAGLGGSSGSGGSGGEGAPIRIGYVTPQTGALALFGEADSYVLDAMKTYFGKHPVTLADGTTHPVEIIAKDTQSDAVRAADVANELILQDDVDLILVSSTPDTVNPVSDQCEANKVVCISTVAPWQAYFFGRGGDAKTGFKYTYHFFWGLEDAQAVYSDIWTKTAGAKASVGLLLPNDPDGNAWADPKTGFPPFITGEGRTVTDPGRYENGTTDFSAQIAQYKKAGDDILTAIPIPPDFTTFWQQAVQQGYKPKTATVAKAILFPAAVEALGKLGNNLSTEVWWHPTVPFSSSLTGQSAQQLASDFEKTTKKQWTQPLGFAEALFEVAVAALEKTKTVDGDGISAALKTLKVDTVVGTVDFGHGPVPGVAKTPLTGGQWRLRPDGGYDLVIVSNPGHPEIPTGGSPEPIDWSGK
ncbi:ABC transporter substrate-binding protein [Microbacterium gorillae]|uniref:ABC transporter substrate-binding protein n=1 Tax=Microbacterium gorillae TaxID=1231063 RepID=UPI0006932A87|nr:ABC transporter substrate-binding protein [Microbacterium gorillae]